MECWDLEERRKRVVVDFSMALLSNTQVKLPMKQCSVSLRRPIENFGTNLTTMAEEWIHYVLTLGPSTVVDLAGLAHSKSSNVFKTARDMGWTTWTPCPKDWCRSKFLIDVVTALIAERRLVPFSKNVRSHAVVLGPRHGHGQPVNRSRKLGHRHIIAPSLIELENSVGIWVSWASKHEEPVSAQPARPLPQVPVVAKHHQRHRPVVPAHDSKGAGYFVPPPSVPSIACQDARSTTQSFTPR